MVGGMSEFKKRVSQMNVDPLELDRFFHEGFYQENASVEDNLAILKLFLCFGL